MGQTRLRDSDVLKALVFLLRMGLGTHIRAAEVAGVCRFSFCAVSGKAVGHRRRRMKPPAGSSSRRTGFRLETAEVLSQHAQSSLRAAEPPARQAARPEVRARFFRVRDVAPRARSRPMVPEQTAADALPGCGIFRPGSFTTRSPKQHARRYQCCAHLCRACADVPSRLRLARQVCSSSLRCHFGFDRGDAVEKPGLIGDIDRLGFIER